MFALDVHTIPLNSSDADVVPPNDMVEWVVPAAVNQARLLIMVGLDVQTGTNGDSVNEYNSVFGLIVFEYPPKESVDDDVPAPDKDRRAAFIPVLAVQVVPSYDSVIAVYAGALPPNDNAEVDVPVPAATVLATVRFAFVVQVDPLKNSVLANSLAANPLNAKEVVDVPAPAKLYLPVIIFDVYVQVVPS